MQGQMEKWNGDRPGHLWWMYTGEKKKSNWMLWKK